MRVDLSGHDLDPAAVADAIRASGGPCDPVHEHVGVVTPSTTVNRRAAMAAAARSRGETASVDEELRSARAELREIESRASELAAIRRRVAETGAELDRLRERVATRRGRLTARREGGVETDETEADYREAVRRLSEAETEHAAAREELAAARDAARRTRDERERRLRIQDRIGNLEREARRELAASVESAVDRAVRAVPDGAGTLETADDPTVAVAVARIADLDAPVVLTERRFSSAAEAGAWLDAPVVRL